MIKSILLTVLLLLKIVSCLVQDEPDCLREGRFKKCRDMNRICIKLVAPLDLKQEGLEAGYQEKCLLSRRFNETCYHDNQCTTNPNLFCYKRRCRCILNKKWNIRTKKCELKSCKTHARIAQECPVSYECINNKCVDMQEPAELVEVIEPRKHKGINKLATIIGVTFGAAGLVIILLAVFFIFFKKQ